MLSRVETIFFIKSPMSSWLWNKLIFFSLWITWWMRILFDHQPFHTIFLIIIHLYLAFRHKSILPIEKKKKKFNYEWKKKNKSSDKRINWFFGYSLFFHGQVKNNNNHILIGLENFVASGLFIYGQWNWCKIVIRSA